MTPEERQLLSALADRIKSAPPQDKDAEADQALQQLIAARPDTTYLLAQTVLMQDFALRNAQTQIQQLQQQTQAAPPKSSGSFLGGLFGGGQSQPSAPASVPSSGPWSRQGTPSQPYAPAPQYQPGYPQQPVVMQPSQTSGFLRSAATTAAGIAGGALLFQGIESLFSGHQGYGGGGFLGPTAWGGGGMPQESLTETTINNNYYGDEAGQNAPQQADYQPDDLANDPGTYQDVSDPGSDFSSDDFGNGDDYA